MNIYELEKQATPGPLVVQGIEDKRTSTDATLTSFTTKFRNPRYVARVYGQGVFSNRCEERDANAKLLAHCRNNFMRALEALKKMYEYYCGEHACSDFTCSCADSERCGTCEMRHIMRKLIAELENVE